MSLEPIKKTISAQLEIEVEITETTVRETWKVNGEIIKNDQEAFGVFQTREEYIKDFNKNFNNDSIKNMFKDM